MNLDDVIDMVDGAEYVSWEDSVRLFFVWSGSLTFTIYNEECTCVDMFTAGERPETIWEVENHINDWVDATLAEWADDFEGEE